VLFGGTKAAVKIRELLINEYGLQAVINLPSGVFKPYSGVGTAILIFDRSRVIASERTSRAKQSPDGGETASPSGIASTPSGSRNDRFIWFYDLTADGFSLDDKRTPIEANDIPDILAKWEKREEGANSYRVPIAKISEDRSLSAGRYKPVTAQTTQHDAPQDILREVLELEEKITSTTKMLLGKLQK
jgi:type I restriction enzyme M protein